MRFFSQETTIPDVTINEATCLYGAVLVIGRVKDHPYEEWPRLILVIIHQPLVENGVALRVIDDFIFIC